MLNYAIKRILLAVVILIVVMLGMFAMVFVIPGDPATVALGPRASPELKALLIARMGLDQPLGTQILSFFGSILKGDLGIDVWSQRPVLDVILEVFPQTLILGVVSLGWALVGGIALGCMAVIWRDSFIDRVLGVLSVAMISVPSFVIALYSLLISGASSARSSCLPSRLALHGSATLPGSCAPRCWR